MLKRAVDFQSLSKLAYRISIVLDELAETPILGEA